MIEFKLKFCPQCGAELVKAPWPQVAMPEMYCSPCHLTFAEIHHDRALVLYIATPGTTEDGSVIPAGVAVEHS